MFSKVPGIGGLKGGSVYTNGLGYDRFYPWKSKVQHPDTLMLFIYQVGVPNTLVRDNAPEEIFGRARDTCTKYRIHVKTTVPHSPWQNLAGASIQEIKKSVQRTLHHTGTPLRLWPQCAEWCTAIQRLTASSIPKLRGCTPTKYAEGSTPDISSYALFDWHQPVFYLTPVIEYPNEQKRIGRRIGVAEDCTDNMAYTILASKGKILVRKSVWAISNDKMAQPRIKELLAKFDESISKAYYSPWPTDLRAEDKDILNSSEDETAEPAESEEVLNYMIIHLKKWMNTC
jgi:hypothetical protein